MRKKEHFGKAFFDGFKRVSTKSFHHKDGDFSNWQEYLVLGTAVDLETASLSPFRKVSLVVGVMVVFALLMLRLIHLQVVEGSVNRELADSNRIQIKLIHAPRGVIYDRNGKILAQNEPSFRLIEASGPATKVTQISRDEALKMEITGDSRYKNLEVDSKRFYPMGEATAHVLGYLGEITGDELKSPEFENYKPGDSVGRDGVEQAYEKTLKGVDGGEIIEVDAQGNKLRSLRKKDAIPGQNLYLTIDADLQKIAFEQLKKAAEGAKSCCGAVVATDPNSGQVLALASIPSFDTKKLADAFTNPNSPVLDRVIAGTYPPGSTFKIASALAGLESRKVTLQTQFEDTGVMSLGPFTFANWYFSEYGRKEGNVDIIKALQRSNDIYFYHLGELTGEDVLGSTAKKLGLGEKLGIDIPGEAKGLIPNNAWKEKNVGVGWYPGDTLHMSIGQGYVLATPLQINNLVSAIAASGKQYPPHLAYKITSGVNVIKEFKFEPTSSQKFKSGDLNLVRKGLELVPVQGGTAWPFFTFPIQTAGKTGTAEFGDPKNRTHAWYTSYAPADSPKLAVTVLVEAGGEGSTVASPVAKEIYRWYFSEDKNNLIKDTYNVATESARSLGE